MENDIMRFDKELESLWHDMQVMDREELEMYTQRLFVKLYNIKYQQQRKEAEERYWAHETALVNPY